LWSVLRELAEGRTVTWKHNKTLGAVLKIFLGKGIVRGLFGGGGGQIRPAIMNQPGIAP